jgi:hypothetical protein
VFKYNKPSHTVVEVSGADFAACSTPEAAKVMATGRDQVALDSPGRRWFVCSVGAHCLNGMKVRIDVLAADDNAVSPSGPAAVRPRAQGPGAPRAGRARGRGRARALGCLLVFFYVYVNRTFYVVRLSGQNCVWSRSGRFLYERAHVGTCM